MAPRIGFKYDELVRMESGACRDDARLVWKSGDPYVLGIVTRDGELIQFHVCGTRELRLLAKQLLEHASEIEDGYRDRFEVVLP